MTDKTPVRVVFDSSNVATGLGEFQTGETVPLAHGGTGAALTIGAAGQVMRVNAAGTAIEFADQGDVDVIASSDSTGVQVQDDLNVSGTLSVNVLDVNEISSQDSTGISISDDLLLKGTLRAEDSTTISIDGGVTISGNLDFGSGSSVSTILDEDNMSSDSATALATQQSIKAYVDTEIGNVSTTTISTGNSSAAISDSGSDGTFTVTADGNTEMTVTDAGMQLGGSGARVSTILDEDNLSTNSDTALATQQSIKAYVDSETASIVTTIGISDSSSNASTLTLGTNDLEFRAGNSITPTVAGTGVTFALNDDITVDQIAAKDSSSVSVTSPLQLSSTLQVAGVVSSAGTPTDNDHLTTVSYVNNNFARSGFPNSTSSEFPVSTDSSATDYQEGSDGIGTATTVDAFGVALTTIFDCMEPIGSTSTTNFGADESHVGA